MVVAITVFIGLSNLAVWLVPALRFVAEWPGVMVVRMNNSVAMIGAAFSLALWQAAETAPRLQRAAVGFALVPLVIGGLTSLEYLFDIHGGIDEWLAPGTFPEDQANVAVVAPGRMSMNASLSLFFLGCALIFLDWEVAVGKRLRHFHPAPLLAALSALPPGLGLVGYLLGQGGFTGILKSTNILFHAAACLVLMAVAVVALRPMRQPLAGLFSAGAEGVLLRWLLPGSSAVLLLLAWLIGRGSRLGLVKPGEGTALMLSGGLVLLFILIMAASRAVRRLAASAEQALAALREKERLSQSILNTSLDGVLLINPAGEVVNWNAAAARMFGWTARDVATRPMAAAVIPDWTLAAAGGNLEDSLLPASAELPAKRLELQARQRDGAAFPVEFNLNALLGLGTPMFVGFVRDITERKAADDALREAKERAEKASQAKDDFLAALSHELRTPLTPVLLSASTLRRDARLPREVLEVLGMIERNVSLEARLIDDLLDLTRIAKGKLQLRSELCDIHDLLGHAVEIVQEEARSRGLTLDIQLQARHRGVTGDPARLQQVFWNLLKNAIKFTPAGGRITVRSRDAEEQTPALIVELSDTGVGFAAEIKDQMFLPFEQGQRAGDHQFGGLGLGLAITRAIVDLHGGEIHAHSEGQNKGATFTVRLPNARTLDHGSPLAAGGREGARKADLPATELKILLVEDHEPTRVILSQLLRRSGHGVVLAGSLREALEAVSGCNAFDVVVSDLGLPDGSGLELLPQLRKWMPELKAIALSGYGMEEDLLRSTAAGFAVHLVKPIKYEQLDQALRQVLA